MIDYDMVEAYRFFREHAGGVVGRSGATALEMARNHRAALARGWSFDWQWDNEPWDADCPAPEYILGCVLRDENGDVLASLWSIGVNDMQDPYLKVVEAELAIEAQATQVNNCTVTFNHSHNSDRSAPTGSRCR